MKPIFHTLCAATLLCGFSSSFAADIKINGKTIPDDELSLLLAERQAAGVAPSPALTNAAREQLISRELFAQEARNAKLDKSADTATRMRMAREEVLARQYQAYYIAQHPPGDAEMRAAYDAIKQKAGTTEYRVRQIFVASEDEAKSVLGRLGAGEKFEALAAALSRDDASRARGGELGWLNALQLQPAMIGVVTGLKAGQVSPPVKGQNGWHLIRLDETRPFVLPPFDQLAPQIRRDLSRRALEMHLADLRKKASVK